VHLNPKIGYDWMGYGQQKEVLTAWAEPQTLPGGGSGHADGGSPLGGGREEGELAVRRVAGEAVPALPAGEEDPHHIGQLLHPRQQGGGVGSAGGEGADLAALPTPVLPRP